jgi:hypothetical protein
MISIEEWKFVFGEALQTTLQFLIEVLTFLANLRFIVGFLVPIIS